MFSIETILDDAPYSWDRQKKEAFFTDALNDLTLWHRERCPEYRRILATLGCSGRAACVEEVPFLPVRIFKEYLLSSAGALEPVQTVASSGTSGQRRSRIVLDRETARNQTKVLTKIMTDFLGSKRLPMLVIDSASVLKNRTELSARGAGILGFSIFGRNTVYALDEAMRLDENALDGFLSRFGESLFLVFGFTSMIWEYFCDALEKSGKKPAMENGILIHGGGWKKLRDRAVDGVRFKERLGELCSVRRIHDYYGMAEQTGSIFVECEHGRLHSSNFSDVLIRRPDDFSLCGDGQRGLIQLVSLLPKSYPGHSILTEDEGKIVGWDDCPCGRRGKTLKIYGRVRDAEVRGCSDTYER